MDDVFVTHPENRAWLEKQFSTSCRLGDLPPLFGVEIRFDTEMPTRKTKEVWHPPENERFVTYEESDHGWLKALGFGRIEIIDEGPLFYRMRRPSFRLQFLDLPLVSEPRLLIKDSA